MTGPMVSPLPTGLRKVQRWLVSCGLTQVITKDRAATRVRRTISSGVPRITNGTNVTVTFYRLRSYYVTMGILPCNPSLDAHSSSRYKVYIDHNKADFRVPLALREAQNTTQNGRVLRYQHFQVINENCRVHPAFEPAQQRDP